MQCLSTVAIVRRETGGWKWPALQFVYMSVLAYTGAFLANQVVRHLVS
jgi:ferrous iron transport protein B